MGQDQREQTEVSSAFQPRLRIRETEKRLPEPDLMQMVSDAGWLEIHYALKAAEALWERRGREAAHFATVLRSLPESRMQAMTIAKLNTIFEAIGRANGTLVEGSLASQEPDRTNGRAIMAKGSQNGQARSPGQGRRPFVRRASGD